MAEILANSASKQMLSGDTAPSQTVGGFVTGEQIVLGAYPVGTNYQWGLAIPSGSAPARSKLSASTGGAPTFIPDVAGPYVLTVNVDGATYTVQLTVVASATMNAAGGFRYFPLTRAAIPAPSSGHSVFDSQDDGFPAAKDSAGNVLVFADRSWVSQAIAGVVLRNVPTLSVQGTATVGDNVPVSATTSDTDGYTTTGVDLYDGTVRLGPMTSGGGGAWSFTINAIALGTHALTARRLTAIGYQVSTEHDVVVSTQTNVPGNINVNSPTGVIQDDLTSGNVQVGL